MDILTPTKHDQLPQAFNDPAGNLLRPAQMMEHYNDIQVAKNDLENPKVQDKGAVRQRINKIEQQYETQAPRPITDGKLKDALEAEANQLLSEIVPTMLSKEEMRKNPPGSTDQYRRGEGSAAIKRKILRWKKIKIVQQADSSDPHTWDRDAANLERYRPDGPQDRFRADAQITGKMTYGKVPDEQWVAAFGSTEPENSALNQAKRASGDPLRDIIAEAQTAQEAAPARIVPPVRQPMSEERKRVVAANLARGREEAKQRRMQQKGV